MAQNYDLQNTGPEVQDRLDQTKTNEQAIAELQGQVSDINAEIGESGHGGNTINGRLDTLETAVGSGGSVDERIAAAKESIIGGASSDYNTLGKIEGELEDTYRKNETYNKDQLDNMITTPNVQYVTVIATSGTTDVTTLLPATGSADTVYRVGNWDGTQYDTTVYALYTWNGSAYVCLAVRSSVDEVYDISTNHPDGQGNPTTYANLSDALGTNGANIPTGIRRGGMSIKFVSTSDNKYVQYRLMNRSFSTSLDDWYNDTEKTFFFNGVECINELYIIDNEIQLNLHNIQAGYNGNWKIQFCNNDGSDFTAETAVVTSRDDATGILQIFKKNTSDIIGYIIVDWNKIQPSLQTYFNPIIVPNDICYNIDYSPSIKAMYNYYTKTEVDNKIDVYVPGVSSIIELYFNENAANIELKLHGFYSGYNGRWQVQFCNNAGSAFTAETSATVTTLEAKGVLEIFKRNTNIVIGYIIVDWSELPSNQQIQLNPPVAVSDACYNMVNSPYIKASFADKKADGVAVNVTNLENKLNKVETGIYESDAEKDYSLIATSGSLSDNIFIQNPKELKLNKVDHIRFKAKTGNTKFYLVTIGDTATWTQVASVDNTSSENGSIKEIDITPVVLEENQYIGINGDFWYKPNEPGAQGFTGFNVTIATGAVSDSSEIALGYTPINTDTIEGRLDSEDVIDTTYLGHSEGNTVNPIGEYVVLAADGSGDYTSFVAAHNYCQANNKNMLIMPGTYNIDAVHGIGYYINYDIIGIGNPTIKCIYEGDDTYINTTFSPFNLPNNISKTIRMEGFMLIAKGVRYCVHDELGALATTSYTHIYKNCKFEHQSEVSETWASPRCIGGGLGNHGLIIIEDCEFKSKIATSVDYHSGYNGGQQSSKVIIKNCVLADNTVSCTTSGDTQGEPNEESVMVVKDCILNAMPICNSHAYLGTKVLLISKSNIII